MPSKGVLDRQRVGKALLAAARTHAHEVGERLQTKFAAVLEDGEAVPDIARLQLLQARLLEGRLEQLVDVDRQDRTEKIEHREPREGLRKASAGLRVYLRAVRKSFRAVYGRGSAKSLLGLTGRVPRDPEGLRLVAGEVQRRLRELIAVGPPKPGPGARLSLEVILRDLGKLLAILERAIRTVMCNELEAEATELLKSHAVEGFDAAARTLADTFQGWCRLAGLPELARKVSLNPRDLRHPASKGA